MKQGTKTFVKGITLERIFHSDLSIITGLGTLESIKKAVYSYVEEEAGWENGNAIYINERKGEVKKGEYMRMIELKFGDVPYRRRSSSKKKGCFLTDERIIELCKKIIEVGFGGKADVLITKNIEERKTFSTS